MFGYIRPLQGELKVRDLERFKACYCGLCHALGRNYGFSARFILNYELVFLAMLLWDEAEPAKMIHKRCVASPLKKKRCCAENRALDACAGYSVILTWWKLKDTVQDETFFKSLPHRLACIKLFKAYKKAVKDFPEFDENIRLEISALSKFESEPSASIDAAADKFANILKAAAPHSMPDTKRRPMLELLYHMGRWIYIIDACDDYSRDAKSKSFNPIVTTYPSDDKKLTQEAVLRLKTTLIHSNNLLSSAFELLPENPWSQINQNLIYLGMPDACERVFCGKWPPKKTRKNRNGHDK